MPMLAPYIYIFHVHIFMLVSTNVLSVQEYGVGECG